MNTQSKTEASGKPMRILHLEDSLADGGFLAAKLERSGLVVKLERVDTGNAFKAALNRADFDLIISDFSLPDYDGMTALALARQLSPETPFIFFSGTMGEDVAVTSLHRGATDYVAKEHPERIGEAVRRAMVESAGLKERREADRRIREQATMLDKARDAICVTDMEQNISYWNESAERLYGWTRGDAIGRNAISLLFRGDVTEPPAALDRLLAKGEWKGEVRQVTRANRIIIVESRWTLLTGDSGLPKSILMVNTDITDRKEFEAQIQRTQRLESIGALANGVAHDLNNLLAPILLAAELLDEKVTDIDSRQMLATLKNCAERGSSLVKQILFFSRSSGGESGLFQSRHLVQDMVKLAKSTFPPSITVNATISADLLPLMGDAAQIHQVLMNLCANARDSMPNGGVLTIEANNIHLDEVASQALQAPSRGWFVKFTVADSGAAIPQEKLEKIFQPYFTTMETSCGPGLGLSTVRGIAINHGGFVQVSSEPGRGTSFQVYLPAVTGSADLLPPPTMSATPVGQGELVLLVDDEIALLEINKAALEHFGYRVLPARYGTEALALYEKHQDNIQLVVTDMIMPIMDGVTLVRELMRLNSRVRVICVSGNVSHAKRIEVTSLGVEAFLAKPYPIDTLVKAVHSALKTPRRCHELNV